MILPVQTNKKTDYENDHFQGLFATGSKQIPNTKTDSENVIFLVPVRWIFP
jgi:hypothetical protein